MGKQASQRDILRLGKSRRMPRPFATLCLWLSVAKGILCDVYAIEPEDRLPLCPILIWMAIKPKKNFKSALLPHLSLTEKTLLQKLSSPIKVQDFLDSFPVNFSRIGEPIKSPSWVVANKKAHCIEAAIFAAAALAYHGQPGILMDLRASNDDEDHVVTLFTQSGLWGAISKTNHAQLRWRDAIYKTPRELALSYFNEYFLFEPYHFTKKVAAGKLGTKTLREYSKPFDITKFDPAKWWSAKDLDWLAEKLDDSPHLPLLPKSAAKNLRKASAIEIEAAKLKEWKRGNKKSLKRER
jgi:hypothetical protein